MPRNAQLWLAPRDAAERLGLSVRRLAQLADEAVLTCKVSTGGHRQYAWPAIRDEHFDWKLRQAIAERETAAPAPDSKEAAQARLANAQADKVEYELSIKRAEYVSVAFMLRELEALSGRLAGPVGALGAQYRQASLGLTPDTVDAFWAQVEDGLRAHLRDAVAAVNQDDSDPAEEPPADDA